MSTQNMQHGNHSIFDMEGLIAFVSGFFGALSYYFRNHTLATVFFEVEWSGLINYSIRSILGGLIGLGIKILHDLYKQRKQKGKPNE